ncbi:neuraminidase-like domain-containing protein [Pseudomonas nunensis]|uniref:Tc toxin subunit A-related protein n=1 Tax=Pseudomonas nunensis TaxID=2961896 RepID=UPI0027B9D807|nr:neuraminidase-like domain-containing protein [Pseudomonas nunensis]
MSTSIEKQLNESRRDALLAMYLHEVVPQDPTLIDLQLSHRIETANDVYEYLLLDVLVSQDVPTSPVACAIASMQQYIHGILLGMEPGQTVYDLSDEQLEHWRLEMNQYPLWAAVQQLHYFPSIYMDPTLRLTKTDHFEQFENDINQNQIQPGTVQSAVLAYLARFEEIANLRCVNGYIDGEDFANSTYYFVGKSPAENAYYWRTLDMSRRPAIDPASNGPKYDKPLPDAWTDWKKANVPISNIAIEHTIRPVWFNKRLFVFWAEVTTNDADAMPSFTPPDGSTGPVPDIQNNPKFRLYGSYKKYDDTWSTPQVYIEHYSTRKELYEMDSHLLEQGTDTIAVYDHSTTPESLFLAIYANHHHGGANNGTRDSYSFLRTLRMDKNFNMAPLFPAAGYVEDPGQAKEANLADIDEDRVRLVGHLFAHESAGKGRFQYWLPTSTPEFGNPSPSTPITTSEVWNYQGTQVRIDNSVDQVNYDRSKSVINIRTQINARFEDRTTFQIKVKDGATVLFELTLVINAYQQGTWIDLLEGSTLKATGTDFFNTKANDYKFELDPSPMKKMIVNWGEDHKFKLPQIARGATENLVSKSIHRDALNLMLFGGMTVRGKLVSLIGGNKNLAISAMEITGDGPHEFRQVILYPLSVTGTKFPPESFTDMRLLHVSALSSSVETWDTLSVQIPINQETKLPEGWLVDWPAGHNSIPLIHGVAVYKREGLINPQYVYQGSALKMLSVGWQASTTIEPQVAPWIDHMESPTLGNAEFIDFYGSSIQFSDKPSPQVDRAPIRMNTTFARNLIQRAEAGMDELLTWETQHLAEPPMHPYLPDEPMDFKGAYYLYFLELFLYMPWLVAYRLNQEQQYDEAERWLAYLFDPMRQRGDSGHPPYWNAVPIAPEHATNETPEMSHATLWPNDPHQIGLSHPVHIRKALYLLLLDIKLNRADHAYLQLTPDSLTEAKLHYVQVLDYLGPRPDVRQVDSWDPITLQDLSTATNTGLREFEERLLEQRQQLIDNPLPDFAGPHPEAVPLLCLRPYSEDPTLPTVDNPHLRLPFNPELIMRWDHAEGRLYNLRHNLDPAGKPLHLPLFANPLDPRALLAAYGQGLSGASQNQFLNPDIPPYRFSVICAHALTAAEQVIQFGNTLLSLTERKEQAQYLELQQQHAWSLAQDALNVQRQALQVDEKSRAALMASRKVVTERFNYYAERADEYMSAVEGIAVALPLAGRILTASAGSIKASGEVAKIAPNTYGAGVFAGPGGVGSSFAGGGQRLEAPAEAASTANFTAAEMSFLASQALFQVESFRRRHQEWEQARNQAELELAQINAQLDVNTEQHKATLLQVTMAQTSLNQARKTYEFLTSSERFTKAQTYDWLNGQFATFYFNAYSSALSLCQAAEACWRYEEADYHRPPAFTGGTWNATYRGLGAGESLKQGLLKLQADHLLQDERELEIRKTVSLSQLKGKDPASTLNKDWTGIQKDLEDNGACEFELTQKMFDDDYPGHYRRRIKSISLTLPVTVGPYEDIRAILSQTYSRVEMSPAPGQTPKDNLRSSQQIALSTGVDDSGMFTLNFQDDRYLPFEYNGAVSKWQLRFPNHNNQLQKFESATDIILHLSYTAVDGGSL